MAIFHKNMCVANKTLFLMYNIEIQVNVRCLDRDAGPSLGLDPTVSAL